MDLGGDTELPKEFAIVMEVLTQVRVGVMTPDLLQFALVVDPIETKQSGVDGLTYFDSFMMGIHVKAVCVGHDLLHCFVLAAVWITCCL